MVSLTGDVETGKVIARTAADNLKRVHLELGGKAPVIVFDDADPVAVAGIKIAGYWNSGQDCTAASRVVAGAEDLRQAPGELVAGGRALAVGDPAEGDDIDMGPVISEAQQSASRVPRAGKGATRVLTGGEAARRRAASSSKPTVVTDVGAAATRSSRARSSVRSSPSAVRGRRRGDRLGQRRRLRPRRVGLDPRRGPGAQRRARSSSSAPSGSTITCRWCARCRTAATSSRATARTSPVLARGLHPDQARHGEDPPEARASLLPQM